VGTLSQRNQGRWQHLDPSHVRLQLCKRPSEESRGEETQTASSAQGSIILEAAIQMLESVERLCAHARAHLEGMRR
jgi:hypothetical protein